MPELGRAALVVCFGLAALRGRRRASGARTRGAGGSRSPAQNALIAAFGSRARRLRRPARRARAERLLASRTSRRTRAGSCRPRTSSRRSGAARRARCSSGSLVLTGYGAAAVLLDRKAGRELVAWVVPVLGVVAAFFSMLVVFVASPFHTQLAAGRRGRAEPEPAEPVLPDPPAAALPRLRRADRPVRVRDGRAPLRPDGRALDRRHPPLDARRLDVPRDRPAARREVGLRGGRLGRLLRVGSGRERGADAVARGDRVPALGDGAGAQGDAEGLEHAARHPRLLALAVRDVPDALRRA